MRVLFATLMVGILLYSLQAVAAIPFFDSLPKYTVSVSENNTDNQTLQKWLQDELKKLRKSSAVLKSYTDARDVARYERGTLQKLLRSRGYYSARVRETVTGNEIHYRVFPGSIYRIKKLNVSMPAPLQQGFSGVDLKVGDPLDAEKVIAGVASIEKYLGDNACLLKIDVRYKATIIHSENAAKLAYSVAQSPEVYLGALRLEGLTTVDPDYLRKQLKLNPGDCFNRNKIDAARLRLLRTNLISVAESKVSPPHNGVVDIDFTLKERNHRTITLGVGFTSDEGAGIAAGWEHRNAFHRGEKVNVDSKFNKLEQSLKGEIYFPRFFHDDQTFSTTAEISKEKRDTYRAESITVGGAISRRLSKHRIASVGSELKFSKIEEEDSISKSSDNFQLLAFPVGLKIDTTDKLLDARRGATVAMEVKPYLNLAGTGKSFVKNTLILTGYLTAAKVRYTPTLAVRVKVGAITGIETLEIPADERFFAGGGGSVRGYGYQTLGPRLLQSSETLGGRGLSEISLEGRFRFTETWGGVVFLDGGNAYAEPRPRFDSSLKWGAGMGIRYITSFAPLRLDLAVPLQKRDGLKGKRIHIYVSLGQAF